MSSVYLHYVATGGYGWTVPLLLLNLVTEVVFVVSMYLMIFHTSKICQIIVYVLNIVNGIAIVAAFSFNMVYLIFLYSDAYYDLMYIPEEVTIVVTGSIMYFFVWSTQGWLAYFILIPLSMCCIPYVVVSLFYRWYAKRVDQNNGSNEKEMDDKTHLLPDI